MSDKKFFEPFRQSEKVYLPNIAKARWVKRFQIGPYLAVVGTECESVGPIYYTHIMYVFEEGRKRPYLAVAAEHTDSTGQDGSRCLSLFFGGTHFNLGFSHDWANLEKFIQKALEVAVEPLDVSESPQELPPP